MTGRMEPEPEPLTPGTPCDICGEEVTPAEAEASQRPGPGADEAPGRRRAGIPPGARSPPGG